MYHVRCESTDNIQGVLRVPLLYGDVEYLGESAATTLASAVFDKKPITIDDWYVIACLSCLNICIQASEIPYICK